MTCAAWHQGKRELWTKEFRKGINKKASAIFFESKNI
jgi:hypothetical protein